MLPLKTIGLLGISPILQCSACRFVPLFSHQDLRPQCFYLNGPTIYDPRSLSRASSTTSSTHPSSASPSSSEYHYRIGAAYSAKGRRFNPKNDLYTFDPLQSTSPGKDYFTGRPNSGQDAFFVTRIGNGTNVAFGVADGVGGWADSGIDSAHFSHGLCERMTEVARGTETEAEPKLRPRELLQKGYDRVVADRTISGGGSTACIAIGRNDGYLEAANLGDSGFIQLRLNAVHHYSNPQTHAFNTPYQLSIIPPKVLARSRALGGKPLSDYPKDASVTNHQLRHGDVLVFATDGVWDNLSSLDLLKIVSRHMTGFQAWEASEKGITISDSIHTLTEIGGIPRNFENSLQATLAVAITGEAKLASSNTKADGPFAKEVQKYYPHEEFHGGKVDDICAVVAIVVKDRDK